MNKHFFFLKIELIDIEPTIFRCFMVPSTITLDRLHDVIQIVMGWTDSHLYEFNIKNIEYIEYTELEIEGLNCFRYRLDELINKTGESFIYLYDFGDSWKHKVTLLDSNFISPIFDTDLLCITGLRACPPEDVGGSYGYKEFLEILKDPTHEEYERNVMWVGEDFDSEFFISKKINNELLKYLQWSRDREQKWDK